MHSDVGRALLGIVNSLWDGKGKPPQDVEQIYETGHRLAVRSAILDLDCSAELAELEELVRAAMARRK